MNGWAVDQHLEFAWSAIDLGMLLLLARVAPSEEVALVLEWAGASSAIGLVVSSSLIARACPRWLPRR